MCIFVSSLFIVCFVSVFHINKKTVQSPSSSSSFQLICQFFRSPSLTLSLSLLCLHLHLTVSHFVMIWSHCHALHVNRYTFYVYALRNRKKSSPKVCFSFLSLSLPTCASSIESNQQQYICIHISYICT